MMGEKWRSVNWDDGEYIVVSYVSDTIIAGIDNTGTWYRPIKLDEKERICQKN